MRCASDVLCTTSHQGFCFKNDKNEINGFDMYWSDNCRVEVEELGTFLKGGTAAKMTKIQ